MTLTNPLRCDHRPSGLDLVGHGSAGGATRVKTRHGVLSDAWGSDVETVETAIGQFRLDRGLSGDCAVVLFEIAGDDRLHVNVIHQHPRAPVRGWAGPGSIPEGSVYNRRFRDTPASQIIRHIRQMVFA